MIIGRKREQESLERAFKSRESQFITMYGRLRVGKTYLVKEFFSQKDCVFLHVTGKQQGKLKEQLEAFRQDAYNTFPIKALFNPLKSWYEAFDILNDEIKKTDKKVVLFFDELPWLATQRSGLLDEIDHYWNNKWAWTKNVIFVACGSSASWMLKNIIYNTGGLYNRTTEEIHLEPFNLAETQEYLTSKNVHLSNKHVVSLYMAVGGIPYYLNYIEPGLSVQQNIQRLFFDKNAPLKNEYYQLFELLFNGVEAYKELLECIAKKREGMSLTELTKETKLFSKGGRLTEKLRKLCDSGLIEKYKPWKQKRATYYKVIDEFCLFYSYWILHSEFEKFPPDHWLIQSQLPRYHAWTDSAFKALCSKHDHQIMRALGIINAKGITSWRYVPQSKKEHGVQIELVFPRYDNAITLCEITYTDKPCALDTSYAHSLRYNIETFRKQTKTDSQLFLSMITTHGLKPTPYSDELINGIATLDDLFKVY